MHSIVHSAGMQDRGGVLPMASLFGLFPFLLKLHDDSGYTGPKFENGLTEACRQVDEIVRRSDAGTFVVLPKRWIAERTIGWLNRCRRLAKDWECLSANGLAFLRWASIRLMVPSTVRPHFDPGQTLRFGLTPGHSRSLTAKG